MDINLTDEEVYFLLYLVEREITETKSEIHHSDNHKFKEDLKVRVNFIQDLKNKINLSVNPEHK